MTHNRSSLIEIKQNIVEKMVKEIRMEHNRTSMIKVKPAMDTMMAELRN